MGLVADIQDYLQGISPDVIDGASGWPSVRRRMHDGSNRLVCFTEDGGFEPETPSDEGLGDTALKEPAVQVRVRAEKWNGDAAYAKAVEIMNLLHGVQRETINSTFYLRIKAQTAEPVFIGYDSEGRPEFTQSFRALTFV